MDGAVNLLKPPGMTSSDAVVWMRRMLGIKKCGHGGTLDPAAAGVLPVLVGKGCQLFDMMLGHTKRYMATIVFGVATDTLDAEGAVTMRCNADVSVLRLAGVFPRFLGSIQQIPPAYSAVRVGGRKAYALARSGRAVDMPRRWVQIYQLRLCAQLAPNVYTIEVACSSGTYIRTLAADMARALGTCAHLAALTRVQSGTFRLEDAVTVEDVKRLHDAGCAHSLITPMEALLAHYPAVWVRPYAQVRARNGGALCARDVDADALAEKPYRVYDKQGLLALCQGVRDQASGQVVLRPKVML